LFYNSSRMEDPQAAPVVGSPDSAPAEPASPAWGTVSLLRDVAISIVLAIVLIVFIYQPVKVEGTSMMPGLTDQERIFINKYEYKLGSGAIQRGDLVVFRFPKDRSQSYIKRVIGVPGDYVEIVDGDVYVNGTKLTEPYVPQEYHDRQSLQKTLIPMNEFFVLGDHRSSSNDSRAWGCVDRGDIYGKAVFVYWPLDKIGRVH
jgi:signal peptidase I